MASPTTNKGYQYPAHGGNVNSWDTPLNADWETLDLNLGGTLSVSLAAGSVVLTSNQQQNLIYTLTGALPGNVIVQWSAVGGIYVVNNQTTGNFSVTLQTAGGGLTTVIPQGYRIVVVATNGGADMIPAVTAIAGNGRVTGNLIVDGNQTVSGTQTVTGLATFNGGISVSTTNYPQGKCQLQFSSITVVKLMPYQGNQVTFPSGTAATIPAAGISSTISNASINGVAGGTLSVGTLYYAYLWDSGGGTYVIDWSTTGHSTDATSGIEIKTGDATRVLVGMAYPVTGPNFADGVTQRYVASWFNRQPKRLAASLSTARTVTSTYPTFTEINSEIRCNFLTWGDAFTAAFSGSVQNVSGNNVAYQLIGLDGISTKIGEAAAIMNANFDGNPTISAVYATTEGQHYCTVGGATLSGGSGCKWGNTSATSLNLMVTI